ncbi:CobW family GTP-binding protein [Agathobaculum sp.]|uniref:CobW family GTP-binding protein n=1 Tax=Agathobaculum sp. TaxID=2048138 RepID=UPI002A81C1C6|nr:CobW family GTP-binding protein [Agathobaculum sp.]MCI5704019.1 GTP-binding protein [Pseudoflavonifractor sp.]MDY3618921.1 CobW family GTP-binding protein [Agathobaculum sp.]
MTKIDIISGFLGAGKTTLIKRLLADALQGEQVVLIENEFGEIGIDGGFLKEAGIVVNEMNAGCICCSLVGDFGQALKDVVAQYHPDRILIEPSGVGKLSDVISAVQNAHLDVQLNSFVTVVDALKAKMYLKNFGEFFENQVAHAGAILLSRTAECPEKRLSETISLLRGLNPNARIVTTPWKELSGAQLLEVMEGSQSLVEEVLHEIEHEHHHHEHEHEHHHEHGEDCTCGCHEHDGHDHHHEHPHDHEHGHHHHEHDEACTCGCHDHHHHDADEVFTSWGRETPRAYTGAELQAALTALGDPSLGTVLRAKGIVKNGDGGEWLHFDYVPGAPEIRRGPADYTGRLCVIGAELDEERVQSLFGV